ncbi:MULTISPECIES: hypothetical protein [unclassified Microcoleus]|uniref:hypothetical protein n=1 Tax=unclassified Microcoleus TaxID=2642155 RepID=UPI002FD65E59
MKSLKSNLIVLGSVGLLFLGACSKGDQASDTNSSPPSPPVASQPASSAPATAPAKATNGGQVVQSGAYYLEFVPEKEATGTHLDVFVQKGEKKEPVPNAKVTAQVQLPNGKQQTLALKYDAEGKHYAVVFPGKDAGTYPVKVTADMNGDKVDGRFTFNQ